MLSHLATCLLGIASLVAVIGPASAEKRVALVIGNSAYAHTAPLKNPSNDATDMTATLRSLGFEVIDGTDLTKREMMSRIRTFADKVRGADVGLFFYAGHGLQVDGRNYLAPVDASLKSDVDLDFEAVELNLVLKQLERSAPLSLVFLDACRDNPLAQNLAVASRSLSIGRGLAQVEKAVGMMIAFATQPGNVALDGEGRNSPYTSALLKHIGAQGQSINDVMIEVRRDVLQQTDGKQVPWENSSLTGQFYFKPSAAQAGTPTTADEIAALREEIERLKSGQAPQGASQADRQIAVEAAGNASSETQLAAVDESATPETAAEAAAPALPPEPTPEELAADIAAELGTLECYEGTPTDAWDDQARDALERFNALSKLDLPLDEPQSETLAALKSWNGDHCTTTVGAPTPKPSVAPVKQAAPSAPAKAKKAVKKPTYQPKAAAAPKATKRKRPNNDGISDAQRELQRAFPSTNWPGGR